MSTHYLQPKQTLAFNSKATEILYGGAAGGGKSHLMRIASIAWCLEISGLQVFLFRRISGEIRRNHLDGPTGYRALLSDLAQAGYARIVSSPEPSISFQNGSKITMLHAQHEHSVFDRQGIEIHVLLVDELTHFTRPMYEFLRSRCRMTGVVLPDKYKGLFPRILAGSNPGGIGHNWVKSMFVTPCQPLEIVKQPKSEGGMLRQYIPARVDDNQALLDSDPDYSNRLQGLGSPALVRAMLEGDWDIVAGGMFDDVWTQKNIIEPFDIPRNWRITRSFDWGSSHPFSVGWWARSNGESVLSKSGVELHFPRGSCIRIGEWYGWNGRENEGLRMTASEVARGILERERVMGLEGRVLPGAADSAIYAQSNGSSIAADMELIGVRFVPCAKGSGSRENGWEVMRGMIKSASTGGDDKGLWVFSTCRQFIRTIPVLPRSNNNDRDIDTNAEDHIADETRYEMMTDISVGKMVRINGF